MSYQIGETSIGGDTDSPNSDEFYGMKVNNPSIGTIKSISLYVNDVYSATKIYLGIYDDSGGAPNTLKATTAESNLSGGAWNTFNVVTPVLLSSGDYWLCFNLDTMWQVVIPRADETYTRKGSKSSWSYAALPATAPVFDWTGDYKNSLYATLDTSSVPVFFKHLQEQQIA